MAALDFPSSPTLNQIYSANGKSWIWDGSAWNPYGGISSAMILLASATASNSAEILFDNEFDSALYSSYTLKLIGVQPASDTVEMYLQLRDSTPTNITSTHRSNIISGRIDSTGAVANANVSSTSGWPLASGVAGNDANELSTFMVNVYPISGQWTHMDYQGYLTTNVTQRFSRSASGALEGTTAPAGVRIYMSSGNISIGIFQLYGIKK